ncbi:hypothetical protein BK809_0000090 [Diplodia seriata]|uniref:DUF7702 domain-containing protein n=1 Tax=Diplodia seriata TaxID=420778 RepID=A0A1S8B9Y8_9PEZI|nr:hypothetical protein BK809_0000090 [Diplodia seriata]
MHPRAILAIVVLLFYTPLLLLSSLLTHRHGLRQSWNGPWFALPTFALTRLLWAALTLAALSSSPPPTGPLAAAATFAIDGLSPLLFAALGLVRRLRSLVAAKRIREGRVEEARGMAVTARRLNVVDLALTAAFVCASVAYRGLSADEVVEGPQRHSGVARAAAGLFVGAFAAIAAAAGVAVGGWWWRGDVDGGEGKVVVALVGALPLLCVRLVYLCLDVLGGLGAFSAVTGSATAFLCMALLEEAVVAAWFVAVGFKVRVVPREETLAMREAEKRAEEVGKDGGDAALLERGGGKLADEEDGRVELDARERGPELDGRMRAEMP